MGKCLTVSGPSSDRECIFPFTWLGVGYNKCTSDGHPKPWCATAVDDNGVLQNTPEGNITQQWGYCNSACPVKGKLVQ